MPIVIAGVLVISVVFVLWAVSPWYGGSAGEILRGVYIEATGAVMDMVVFGVVIALMAVWTEQRRERDADIERQRELIDDFKKWNVDEARLRIAGALRRLNRLGCTTIDFSGCELSNFSFGWHEIGSIAGSTFYDGSLGMRSRKGQVTLEGVDFSRVDCRNVVFSKFNPFSGIRLRIRFATFKDCEFQDARLQGATFRGAHIEWSKEPPEEMGVWEELGDGEAAFMRTYRAPFDGVDLTGVSFDDVVFKNADFRDALNVQKGSFKGAQGLDECVFDNEKVKGQVLEAARADSQEP